MAQGKHLLQIRGADVGNYAAMVCSNCGYFYFTEDDYDLALATARSVGLAGPVLERRQPSLLVMPPMISYFAEPAAANTFDNQGKLLMNIEASNAQNVRTERLVV